jgi:N-acetyl-anhydromuramoyl-L-alanine amidase
MKARPKEPSQGRDGWVQRANRLASANFGPRPDGMPVSLIVIHSISLPPGEFGGGFVQALFMNELDWEKHPYFQSIEGLKVSAHFYIERNGNLWQFVSTLDRAWHAGASSFNGRENCNDFSVGIELEGLEGEQFEPAQYRQLARLCREIKAWHPIEHIVGHEHVAPSRKLDPGDGFDWHRLQADVGWAPQCFPVLDVQS